MGSPCELLIEMEDEAGAVDVGDAVAAELTGAAGALAVLLPAVGASLGARLGGSTDLSRGSLVPSLVGAGLMLFPGYAFSLSTVGQGSEAVNTIGSVFLLAGVPIAVTLADRLYRKLR